MKIFVILILFTVSSFGQTYEELQDIFFYTSKKLDEARDSIRIMNQIKARQDIIIGNYKKVVITDSVQLHNCEQQVEILKIEATKIDMPPLITFRGFYTGVSVNYRFDSEIITQQTIIAGLKYDLTGSFKFEAIGRIDLTGQVYIPLRKESFGIKVNAEYKLF